MILAELMFILRFSQPGIHERLGRNHFPTIYYRHTNVLYYHKGNQLCSRCRISSRLAMGSRVSLVGNSKRDSTA